MLRVVILEARIYRNIKKVAALKQTIATENYIICETVYRINIQAKKSTMLVIP